MKQVLKMFVPIVLVGLMIAGCGNKVRADKPISEVKSEVKAMSVEQLKTTIAKYKEVIQSKKTEIDQLAAKLKKIPVAQMMGEEAGKIKTEIQNITTSVRALTGILNVYSQALRSK